MNNYFRYDDVVVVYTMAQRDKKKKKSLTKGLINGFIFREKEFLGDANMLLVVVNRFCRDKIRMMS